MLTPSFHFSILDQYAHGMNSHSLEAIRKMRQLDDDALVNIELSEWAINCTMAILLETIMGVDPNDPECAKSEEYMNALNEYEIPITFWRLHGVLDGDENDISPESCQRKCFHYLKGRGSIQHEIREAME